MAINLRLHAAVRTLLVLALNVSALAAQEPARAPQKLPFDAWLTNAVQFPPYPTAPAPDPRLFAALHSEVIGDQLKVLWPAPSNAQASVTLHASAASPGHWPMRDWRRYDMTWRSGEWEANLPVEDLSVPIVYYVRALGNSATNHSPNRVVHPARSGLDLPSKIFWPFLEGFENGLDGWRVLAGDLAPPRIAGQAHDGNAALLVIVPAGKNPAGIATTRVRGWQIVLEGATGLRLWMRTRSGEGRVNFGLYAAAYSPDHATRDWPRQITVGPAWQKIDLSFAELREGFPLGETDLFSIEFAPGEAREYLIDDFQFLGPWRLDGTQRL